MSTHNIGFYEETSKIIPYYHRIRTLSLLLIKHLPCFRVYPSVVCIHFSLSPVSLTWSSSVLVPAEVRDKSHMNSDEIRNYNTSHDYPS